MKNAAPVTADLPDMEVLACGPGILTLCHLVAVKLLRMLREMDFTKRTKGWFEDSSTYHSCYTCKWKFEQENDDESWIFGAPFSL